MTVKLGTFVFQDMEIPERINFSGEHTIVKHQLIGGGRTLDAMGDNPGPIQWSGIFLYGDAANRARTLDAMKASGGTYQLTWGTFSRKVKIKWLDAEYRYEYNIPYKICVEVLPASSDQAATQTLDTIIQADFATVAGIAVAAASTAAVASAQAAVATAAAAASTGQVADAPLATVQAASSTAQDAANTLIQMRDDADAAFPVTDLDSLNGAGAADFATALAGLASGAGALSDAATAAAYMSRIAGNLALHGG